MKCKCIDCGEKFDTAEDATRHIISHHRHRIAADDEDLQESLEKLKERSRASSYAQLFESVNAIDELARKVMDPAVRQPIHAHCERIRNLYSHVNQKERTNCQE